MILGAGAAGRQAVEVVAGGAYPDWCERCMSSAAVRVRLYVLCPDGPRLVGLWWACMGCDPDRFDDQDGDDDALVPA